MCYIPIYPAINPHPFPHRLQDRPSALAGPSMAEKDQRSMAGRGNCRTGRPVWLARWTSRACRWRQIAWRMPCGQQLSGSLRSVSKTAFFTAASALAQA